jgi:glycosyltransferase involved in cell wall biosynthesis
MIDYRRYQHDAYLRRYVDALLHSGAQVDVLCLQSRSETIINETHGLRIFAIPATRSTGNLFAHFVGYSLAFVLFTLWLLVLHAREHYQVIHVHNMPDFLIFTAFVPKMLGARLILDIRDPMPEFYQSRYELRPQSFSVRALQLQEKASAAMADAVITANTNFKENLKARGITEEKITVLPYIPDPRIFDRHRFKKNGQAQTFTLIYPGTLAPRYGLDLVIRALPLLRQTLPQVRLSIIGPQISYSAQLTELAERLAVSASVTFTPLLPMEEIAQQIADADIGIYPALPDPHMNIATPMKVLEYATMGIPIIASRLKVLEDLFGDGAVLFFEPGEVEQFARCVLELFDNPDRRLQLIQTADKVLLQYNWEDQRHAYLHLLNCLSGSGSEEVLQKPKKENPAEEIV